MKTITIQVPDDFTQAQIRFIRKSAYLQIKAEMEKVLTVPQADIDAVKVKTDEIGAALGVL